MNAELLRFIADALDMVNTFERARDPGDRFYLGVIPVMWHHEVVGELRDEIGGEWTFHPGNGR